jgi:hypothetical protein
MHLRPALTAVFAMLLCLAAHAPVQAQSDDMASSPVEHASKRPMPRFTDTPRASDENAAQEASPDGISPDNIVGADSHNSNPTTWWVYTGQTGAQVTSLINSLKARIIDIHVDSTTPTFTVTMVADSGTYNKTWWWYYGATAAQVSSLLTTNNARPISVKAYVVGGVTKFAVVMISNTGSDAKTYWWYYGESVSGISTLVTNNKARLVTIDPYSNGSSTVYTAIMIANSGADSSGWWWYVNASPNTLTNAINQNKARLFYLSAGTSGTFDAIMESCSSSGCPEWWWYYGETASGLVNQGLQNGGRLLDVTTYPGCRGGTCFAGPMINNSNATTTRVGNILRNNGVGGTEGLYLKKVGGQVLANLEDAFVYEPASAIKVVNNLYAVNQVYQGNIKLSSPITHYVNGPDSCPNPADPSGTEPLDLAMREMMWHSDNARTAEIDDWFGFANVNSYAASIGMKNTKFNGYVGCGTPPNTFTLDDASTLYEGVANQTLLHPAYRGIFYSSMAGRAEYESEGYDFTGIWDNDIPKIINQVAPAGTTAAQKTAYMNAMNVAYKAGGYTLCQSDCAHILEDVDIAGWFQLPVCTASGAVTYAQYTWGIFFSNAPDNSWYSGKTTVADTNFTAAKSELMRGQIATGMQSCAGKSLNVMTYSPGDLVFSSQTVGTTSAAKTITVTNKQATAVNYVNVTIFGEFTLSHNCPASLASGQSCTITVHFKPAGTGERTGAVVVSDSGSGQPQAIELTGTGS